MLCFWGDYNPKSTNHIYKYACRGSFPSMYMTADGRTLKDDYQWQARSQFHREPHSGRLEIDVTLYFNRKGRKDWDNFHKLSMDALSRDRGIIVRVWGANPSSATDRFNHLG